MTDLLKQCGRDTSGATAVEYGLIVALIFLAALGAMQAFGTSGSAMYNRASSAIVAATS
jgi:pilus assembly protein Flp/PilA